MIKLASNSGADAVKIQTIDVKKVIINHQNLIMFLKIKIFSISNQETK